MKHRVGFNRLGRKPSHRRALHRNMVTSLFKYERIRTTKAKAREIRRSAEKMITRAKVDSVHNRRMVARDIKDKAILAKLFVDIGPRFKERPGGYTRMLKIGHRRGDASEMVLLELVSEEIEQAPKKKRSRKAATPKAETAAVEQPAPQVEARTDAESEAPESAVAEEDAAGSEAEAAGEAKPDEAAEETAADDDQDAKE
ncbi:MAG: 50S ribosomal protein L17 [Spirochaetota bacterium]